MTDEKPGRRNIIASDVDAQGNVTVWDYGPQPPEKHPGETDPDFKARSEIAAHEAEAWNKTNVAPIAITIHRGDAGNLLSSERYAIEPREIDEAQVEAEVKKIQEARAAAAAAPQNAADRKFAIGRIMSERKKPEPVTEQEKHS